MLRRYLESSISKDLSEKMLFIVGPRQVGKTMVALELGNRGFVGKYAEVLWGFR